MTELEHKSLWELARVLHEARKTLAWGPKLAPIKEPFPEWHRSYLHNPITYVDLALAQAKAATDFFKNAAPS